MEKKTTEADVFLGMLERAEKRAEEAKIKDPEKEVEKLVEKAESLQQYILEHSN